MNIKQIILGLMLISIVSMGNESVLPLAVIDYEARKMDDSVADNFRDLLHAFLSEEKDIILVERKELKAILSELSLNQSGLVKQQQALQLGQLTGAKVLIFGSIFKVGDKRYVASKIVSTETSKVDSVVISGKEELDILAQKSARLIAEKMQLNAKKMLITEDQLNEQINNVKTNLRSKSLPDLTIAIREKSGDQLLDSRSVHTNLAKYYQECGGQVIVSAKPNYHLKGNCSYELSAKRENLFTVTASIQVSVFDGTKEQFSINQVEIAVAGSELKARELAVESACKRLVIALYPKLGTIKR